MNHNDSVTAIGATNAPPPHDDGMEPSSSADSERFEPSVSWTTVAPALQEPRSRAALQQPQRFRPTMSSP